MCDRFLLGEQYYLFYAVSRTSQAELNAVLRRYQRQKLKTLYISFPWTNNRLFLWPWAAPRRPPVSHPSKISEAQCWVPPFYTCVGNGVQYHYVPSTYPAMRYTACNCIEISPSVILLYYTIYCTPISSNKAV